MDELDILKKDWQKADKNQRILSSSDIYPMLLKKSSSIVKTLFYISLGELVFWILINSIPYFTSNEYKARLESIYGDGVLMNTITIVSYAIILLFIYLLFKSHKEISVTDNAKKLMESILKTRKVIKWYVAYNLVMAFLSLSFGLYLALSHNPELSDKIADLGNRQMFIFSFIMVLFVAAFIIVIWLFYKLLYGILLKRLNANYKELKKLEV